jgi:23S rRNA maturation mini-RNase III
MKFRVLNYNKDMLEGFNKEVEIKGLHEKVKAFFDSETTAQRISSFMEVLYAWEGTKMKCAYNCIGMEGEGLNWIETSIECMYGILLDEFGQDQDRLARTLVEAEKIVCLTKAYTGDDILESVTTQIERWMEA